MKAISLNKGEKIKKIKDYPNYCITSHGRVLSYGKNVPVWLKPQKDKMGYLHIRVYNDKNVEYYSNGLKKPKLMKVHRVVCQHFLPKPKPGQIDVNHKNFNKTDNRVENLEWCSREENMHHSWRNGKMKNVHLTGTKKRSHAIRITYKDGKEVYCQSKTWAFVYLKCSPKLVIDRCKDGKITRKGFKLTPVKEIPEGAKKVSYKDVRDGLVAYYKKYYPRKWSQL